MLGTGPWYRRPDTPLLVGHLMYSAPPKSSPAARAGASALSLLLHASLLTAAVLLITDQGPATRAPAPSTTDLILPTDLPDPVPPPPAPVVGTALDARSVPGYQVLPTPISIPTEIPPIQPGPITSEADFGAVGVEGGRGSAPQTTSGSSDQPDMSNPGAFIPYTLAPVLKNVEAVQRALVRAYPAMLRDAGVTGRVLVWVLVDEQGQVMKALVKQTSAVPALDDAALSVARTMEFRPGMNRDIAVKVWVALPIDFRVGR